MKTYKENVIELEPGDSVRIRTSAKIVNGVRFPEVEVEVGRVSGENNSPFTGPFLQVYPRQVFREAASVSQKGEPVGNMVYGEIQRPHTQGRAHVENTHIETGFLHEELRQDDDS